MAKRKHYFVIVFAFCFLLVFWGYRVWKINKEAVIIPQEEYAKGEWVNLDACKIEQYAVMTGYEIKVEDTSRMNVDEYLKKYASGEEIKEYWQKVENHLTVEPDEIFMVHVKVRNTSTVSDNTNGLNWLWMYLIDKDKSLDMNAVYTLMLIEMREAVFRSLCAPRLRWIFICHTPCFTDILTKMRLMRYHLR